MNRFRAIVTLSGPIEHMCFHATKWLLDILNDKWLYDTKIFLHNDTPNTHYSFIFEEIIYLLSTCDNLNTYSLQNVKKLGGRLY